MDNPRSLHDLRRFWEAIALGQPAAPGDLDPELAALVQRLHATPDVPPPDPSFASHLREQLMHATTAPVLPASAPPNGQLPDAIAPGLFPPFVAPRRTGHTWPIAQVAIILLVLAAIIGAYVFTQRTRPEPTFTPAISTPAPAGAIQDWPMYRANPARSGVSGDAGPAGSPVQAWAYHAKGPVSRSPAVADGVAYLQSGDGVVIALNAATGDVLWQNTTTDAGENTPAVAGDTLYVINLSGQVVALDRKTGVETWRGGELLAAECTPLVLDGVLYMGSDDGKIFAFDAATGEQRWQSAASGGIFRSLAVGGGLLYAGTINGRVDAFDLATGEARWHFAGGDDSQTIGTPTYSDGVVYANYNGIMFALDAATGEQRWSKVFAGARPATVANGMIFSGGLDGTVYAIDAATGDDRWTFPTGDEIQAAPALVGNVLYVASFDRTLYALDPVSGSERWSFDLDGAVVYGPSVAQGVIYAGTDAGTLYAIGGSGTSQLVAPVEGTPAGSGTVATPNGVATSTGPVSLAISAAGEGPRIDDVSYLRTFTSPDNPFPAPGGIDVGPDDTLYVADSIKNLVYLFDANGNQRAIWGGPDDPDHQFLFGNESFGAGDINVGPDGSIYILEMLGNRIQKLAPDGTPVKTWGAPGAGDGRLNKPGTLTIGPDGNLYVADTGNNRIEVFDTDGNFLRAWGEAGTADGKLRGPWEIAFRPEGTLLVTDAGLRIGIFDKDGTFLGNFRDRSGNGGDLNDSYNIRVDAGGNIYLGDYEHNLVSIVTPDGATLASWGDGGAGPGTFNLPSSVALDAAGKLYVSDDDDRVQVFQLAPTLLNGVPATPVP